MVARVRAQIEKYYIGKCTVYVKKGVKQPNGSTKQDWVPQLNEVPCRLSFKALSPTDYPSLHTAPVVQQVKLFLKPEIEVPEGSKIVVIQNGNTETYMMAGVPALYATHQEIILVVGERRA